MPIVYSGYQNDVFDHIKDGKHNLVLKAFAGSAKTTTIVKGLEFVPTNQETFFCAFNKRIAEEIATRVPWTVNVSTLHSYGFRAVIQSLGKQKVDSHRTSSILSSIFPNRLSETYELRQRLAKAVGLCKSALANEVDDVDAVLDRFGFDTSGADLRTKTLTYTNDDRGEFIEYVIEALNRCRKVTGSVDFDDMVWLPNALNLPAEKFDRVFVDECLPKETPVLLADKTSISIGEIVENKLPVKVLAYDTKTGKQRACRVVGWQKIPNQKPLMKIKVKWTKRIAPHSPSNFVVCTTDHKIWADGKWIQAGQLKPGMIAQVETDAEKSQMYKITSSGRKTLAKVMTRKNKHLSMGRTSHNRTPRKRGGNGTGLTIPESILQHALGKEWIPCTVTTKASHLGYPTHYKIDLAHLQKKIAVEVDGSSHNNPTRRAQDKKKEAFLKKKGWKVIRIKNREAVQNTQACIQQILSSCGTSNGCPIDAVVESVEPINIPDYFVYDITVEDCHNFYANGILVHNCQDLTIAQVELALKSLKKTSKLVTVGDENQMLYAWAGAHKGIIDDIATRFKAKILPLPICYRCPKSVVLLAQTLVPGIQPAPNAPEGSVEDVSYESMFENLQYGDVILSRANAPLLNLCFQLLSNNRRVKIQGRDIGGNLAAFVRKSKCVTVDELVRYTTNWEESETTRLMQRDPPRKSEAAMVADKAACIRVLTRDAQSTQDVLATIDSLFSDVEDKNVITLSSTHKFKGLEADRVWLLMDTYRNDTAEERNIMYVAITRAKSALFLVRHNL